MLRTSTRLGLITVALSALPIACGSSNDVPADQGAGGAYPGGFPSAGGFFGGAGVAGNGGFGVGGLGAAGAGGLGIAGGGGFGAGGLGAGGAGAGGNSAGGTPAAGGATDGGNMDGAAPVDGGADASLGSGGGLGAGGKGAGGAGAGGGSTADAGVPFCGNSIVDGTDKCDTGAIDTTTCDSDCTKPACNDKHVNVAAGEVCDDGNNTNGDGCDSTCQLENTCPAPAKITLTASVPGTIHATVADDSTDGTSYVNPALCDGTARGAGPDAVYQFTLDRTRNVSLSLTAGFDAILRTYTKACVPGASLDEAGGDACSNKGVGTESMSFSRLPQGTYFVVVDGAAAGDKGAYTLDVSATCDGIDGLRIVELGIGATDYAVIRNMSDCPTALGGVTLKFDDSTQPDLVTTLPAVTLAPGEQLRIQENLGSSVPGAISAGGQIPFQYDRGGTVLLCKSNCGSAADVLDVLQFADGEPSVNQPPPAPPGGISVAFPLTGIDATNQNTKSWVRVGSQGKNPSFTGGDYCTGEPDAVFGLRLEEVFIGDPDFVSMKNHADCAVPVAPFRVRLSTGGVATPIDAVLDAGTLSLGKGAKLFLSEPPNAPGDVNTGVAIPNVGGISGTVQLCFGSCATAGTTVDAIAWNGVLAAGGTPTAFPPLPVPITFSPDGLTGLTDANQQTSSYRRAAIAGSNSRFLASDWTTAAKSR